MITLSSFHNIFAMFLFDVSSFVFSQIFDLKGSLWDTAMPLQHSVPWHGLHRQQMRPLQIQQRLLGGNSYMTSHTSLQWYCFIWLLEKLVFAYFFHLLCYWPCFICYKTSSLTMRIRQQIIQTTESRDVMPKQVENTFQITFSKKMWII